MVPREFKARLIALPTIVLDGSAADVLAMMANGPRKLNLELGNQAHDFPDLPPRISMLHWIVKMGLGWGWPCFWFGKTRP